MASISNSEPTEWTPPEGNCDKCGAPASWADEWTKNLSWGDGCRLLRATYFASPRMWPLGYLLGSNYSPLRLEQQVPDFNWRDRFEDLLALESGKKMISAASRQTEAVTASRIRNESVHEDISHVNQLLQQNQAINLLLQKLREVSVRRKDSVMVSAIDDEAIPHQKKSSEMTIASGKALIGSLEGLQNKPASNYKHRLPWITSLISSGAMPGWESTIYDSSDGCMANVRKADDSGDGYTFSELDLTMNFIEGHPLEFRGPNWSTYAHSYGQLYYPQIQELCPDGDADPHAALAYRTIDNVRPSILSQSTKVQKKKAWNGSTETRVVIKNCFTDGKEVEATIVNDASKVLEEVEKFHASLKERHRAIGLALWKLQYQKQQDAVTLVEELEDEGL